MARNNTEQKCNAACPFAGVIIEVGDKIPGKPSNFRMCLTDCALKKINDMSAGVDLKEDKNISKDSPILISRCSLFEIMGGKDLIDLRIQNMCQMGGIPNLCTRIYSEKGDGFDQKTDRYAELYWRACVRGGTCQKLTPVGMIAGR